MNAHSVVNSVDESANKVPILLGTYTTAAMKNADLIALKDTDLLLD